MSERRGRILVVDDDPIVAESITGFLSRAGYDAVATARGEEALAMLEEAAHPRGTRGADPFAVIITDMAMHGMDGLTLIRAVRERNLSAVPLVITGYGTIESAVAAIRHGAIDYLTKPVVDDELRIAVEKAVRQHALLAENVNLRRQLSTRDGLDSIIGADSRMQRIYDAIEAVAPTKTTVLMSGESGTGKSLIARAIHRRSTRAEKPFVEISCGSIPETLLESELFGHVKGAFTGAHADKIGRFLAAEGGTIFLDEINSASPGMQLKLLRVLQERRFEPVGSSETIEVDVRVILASNQKLDELVARGEFRQDLYYRINVILIELAPLRERLSDIPLLAAHFLERHAREAKRRIVGFSEEAMRALRAYSYPGNVRELENIIERAVVLTRHQTIQDEDLPAHVLERNQSPLSMGMNAMNAMSAAPWRSMPLAEALKEPERQIILAALEAHNWNRQQTAEALDINRTTLYKKIKQYDLEQYGRAG